MTELLSDHTTFRVGGPVGRWVEGNSAAEIVEAVKQVDAAGDDLLVLSGGSNILASDEGFAGTVVHVASKGIEISESFCDIDLAACGGVQPSHRPEVEQTHLAVRPDQHVAGV